MEVEKHEVTIVAKRRGEILDRVTFLEKNIKILDPERFM
jgi:hypothetical protein